MNGRLYSFNDPDAIDLYDYASGNGYGAAANKMRVLSAAVTGTVFLSGDDLTTRAAARRSGSTSGVQVSTARATTK